MGRCDWRGGEVSEGGSIKWSVNIHTNAMLARACRMLARACHARSGMESIAPDLYACLHCSTRNRYVELCRGMNDKLLQKGFVTYFYR